jgi:5-methylcytosine-specific restriction endonuclease McrA
METIIKHKRGDVREDGMVFWALIRKQGYWVSKEKFEENNTPDLTLNQKLIIETIYLQRIRLEKRLGIPFHVDHVIPISKGGLHIPSNLQVLPAKLNLKKNSKNSLRWEELQFI